VDHVLIGELSARTGVSHRMLRYYEEQGLLPAGRDPNGYRRYSADAVRTVRQIRALLAAGLTTGVIRTVIDCAEGEAPHELRSALNNSTLRRELSQMDARIGALQRSRGALAAYLR
jgi:DNA-binding transcriptional MerR regulator